MSYPTKAAFVNDGDWSEATRQHPATKWLEGYTGDFDAGIASMSTQIEKYHTSDFTFVKPDGSVHTGIQAGFAAAASMYAPLTVYHHQPTYVTVSQNNDGDWVLFGIANLYYSLPGEGPSANATDATGKSYDGVLPGAFRFTIGESDGGPDGLKLKRTEVMSDSGPIVVQLLQRGVLKPSDIGL